MVRHLFRIDTESRSCARSEKLVSELKDIRARESQRIADIRRIIVQPLENCRLSEQRLVGLQRLQPQRGVRRIVLAVIGHILRAIRLDSVSRPDGRHGFIFENNASRCDENCSFVAHGIRLLWFAQLLTRAASATSAAWIRRNA
jgi:hypothetical protein